jgi:hypothetical protein
MAMARFVAAGAISLKLGAHFFLSFSRFELFFGFQSAILKIRHLPSKRQWL